MFPKSPLSFSRLAQGVDLSTFPQELATFLNIGLFPAQLLTSTIVLSFFIFPTLLLTRARNQTISVLLVGFSTMGFLIAVGWLPVWIFVIIALFTAILYAGKIKGLAG